MDIGKICTNCLQETVENGVCTSCGKRIEERPPRQMNALPDGYVLHNQYVLGRIIGKGGFGITYLARDIWQGRRVIVKELYPHNDVQRNAAGTVVVPLPGQEAFFAKCRQRFRQEAQVLESFRAEPDIVDVYETITENNTEYYSMEYLSGWDLRTLALQKGRVGWNELSEYVKSILRTLNILHSKNLIHRDISPDNIFLVSNTQAKLIDFGSVRCFTDGQGLTAILKQVYAPVEQYFTDGHQGPWTDIYALSATLYHVMTGTKPPQAPSRVGQNGPDPLVPVSRLCPNLPPHVAGAIMKGMAVRDTNRFQSAREMAAALYPGEDIFNRNTGKTGGGYAGGHVPGGESGTGGLYRGGQNSADGTYTGGVNSGGRGTGAGINNSGGQNSGGGITPGKVNDGRTGVGGQNSGGSGTGALNPVRVSTGTGAKKGFFEGLADFFRMLFGRRKVTRMLRCVGGVYQGAVLEIAEETGATIGRSPACSLSYPQDSKGISRTQLNLRCEKGGNLLVMDESTYGTVLNGGKMVPKNWYRLDSGAVLNFAGETWQAE
ncbi:MAG: FHA domain-containing serine/threonine-protein kinase [Lachnospiraceae bacterium]|nr:FHA domain-containing serine/threonine-protein kinase [Lachnospiraceae bacterium]